MTSFTFTLPSGAVCEQRIGNVMGGESEEAAAVEEFYGSTDFEALLTEEAIAEVIERRRSQEPGIFRNTDGSEEPTGYGTARYSADDEHWMAVWDLVTTALDAELAERGLDENGTDLSFSGEANCPGADW